MNRRDKLWRLRARLDRALELEDLDDADRAIAEHYREVNADRLRAAREAKRELVGVCEGQSRLGYRKRGGKIVPDPAEQDAIAIMRRCRRDGMTLRETCSELEKRGIKPRRGARWHPNTVRRVLSRGNRPFAER